ncbi:MAG: DUF1868 domain-containing protein [Alphaproteobacteria bacterium]
MEGTAPPVGVGRKFYPDGRVRTFPGNTIVCHVTAAAALVEHLNRLHERLRVAEAARLYTLLPPSSWHMTLFDGVTGETRAPDHWPEGTPLDAPLEDVHRLFEKRLTAQVFGPELTFAMRVTGFGKLRNVISLSLQPASAAEKQAIRCLRDRLAAALRLRRASHDTYGFHITLAYFLVRPGEEEAAELNGILTEEVHAMAASTPPFLAGPPEFCRFNDMFAFNRQFFLR